MALRLFGTADSVYVRIVRLVLAEKGVGHELVPVDVFASGGPPPAYRARHPFGRMPAFEHDGFALYETGAIERYIDEAFPGPALQPADPRRRARCNQIVSIADAYAYRPMVWDLYVERVERAEPDETRIAAALPAIRTCLAALAGLMEAPPFLVGDALSLADLHLAPMVDYLLKTPEGPGLLAAEPELAAWWAGMAARPSLRTMLAA